MSKRYGGRYSKTRRSLRTSAEPQATPNAPPAGLGPVRSVVVFADYTEEGFEDSLTTTTNSYDRLHRLIETVQSGPGWRTSNRYEYNSLGQMWKLITESGSPDVVQERWTTYYAYDARGNVTSQMSHQDYDADGITDILYMSRLAYDSKGRFASEVRETDTGNDGSIDGDYATTTVERDSAGRMIRQLDLTFDSTGSIVSRFDSRNTFDAGGNLVAVWQEWDWDGDGPAEAAIDTATMTYNATGQLLLAVNNGSNGASRLVNTYDSRGNLLTGTSEADFDANGIADYRQVVTTTYDSASRAVRTVNEQDSNGDGVFEYRIIETWAYDARGNVTVSTNEQDTDADGPAGISSRSVTTSRYDARGHLVETVFEQDGDGDGPNGVTYRETTTFSY